MPLSQLEQEHDQLMFQNRRRVFAGAGLLAGIAGYVNVVMLGFFATPVSYMSGAVSQMGIDIAIADIADLLLILSILAGFFVGALISGLVLETTHFRMRRRYAGLLIFEGLLLAVATRLAITPDALAVPMAAAACGLQNAMAGSYRGLILRTTHVTGIVTDLGALLGNRVRGRQVQGWKFGLLLTILAGFFVGGLVGALLFQLLGMQALGVAALCCLILGVVTIIVLQRSLREARESGSRTRTD